MNRFTEVVKQDTPRLVVTFSREGDTEKFGWGVVGQVPVMTLIGAINDVQACLIGYHSDMERCDQSTLVVAWDAVNSNFEWFVHQDIPVHSLVGMLEIVKATLVMSQMEAMARAKSASHNVIIGADGIPIQRSGMVRRY